MKVVGIVVALTLVSATIGAGGVALMDYATSGEAVNQGLGFLGSFFAVIGGLGTLLLGLGSLNLIFNPNARRQFAHGPSCNCRECAEERRIEIFLPPS